MLGAKHPDTLDSSNNLACVLEAQGELEEAARIHRETLEALGITHVLNVADDVPNFHEGAGIEYCNLSVGDFGTDVGISRVFPTALGFVRSALESPGGRVLIHCGTTRSNCSNTPIPEGA